MTPDEIKLQLAIAALKEIAQYRNAVDGGYDGYQYYADVLSEIAIDCLKQLGVEDNNV